MSHEKSNLKAAGNKKTCSAQGTRNFQRPDIFKCGNKAEMINKNLATATKMVKNAEIAERKVVNLTCLQKVKEDARAIRNRQNFRKYQDYRFRKNEQLIFEFYFKSEDWVSVEIFAQMTGISKSTFYRHHRCVGEIQVDYEDYLLYKFTVFLGQFKKHHLNRAYLRMLCFIVIEKHYFEVFVKRQNDRILREMIHQLKPKIQAQTEMKKIAFNIYVGEIAELIRNWIADDCRKDEVGKILRNITYLTDTATRLNKLED